MSINMALVAQLSPAGDSAVYLGPLHLMGRWDDRFALFEVMRNRFWKNPGPFALEEEPVPFQGWHRVAILGPVELREWMNRFLSCPHQGLNGHYFRIRPCSEAMQ